MNVPNNMEKSLQNERTESLMLMSIFGDSCYRYQAMKELQNRRLIDNSEQIADGFMTNLGVIF